MPRWSSNLTAKTARRQCGFTLLEVMLVVVVIGLMATLIVSNLAGSRPENELKLASDRFVAVFNLANEYALLNNVELGLVVDKNHYQFVGFDGEYWRELGDSEQFAKYEVKSPLQIALQLDDLPIDESALISTELFAQEDSLFEQSSFDEVEIAEKDSEKRNAPPKKKIIPQVYILSGGEITPFKLSFKFEPQYEFNSEIIVTGSFSLPLKSELVGQNES